MCQLRLRPRRRRESAPASDLTRARQCLYTHASRKPRATLAQLVEHVTENHGVPSSILGGRTIFRGPDPAASLRDRICPPRFRAGVAQLVEHFTRNEGVPGSIPGTSSMLSRGRRGPRRVRGEPMSSPLMISVAGVRGIVGESLTPPVVTSFAAAFARELPAGAVVIGR